METSNPKKLPITSSFLQNNYHTECNKSFISSGDGSPWIRTQAALLQQIFLQTYMDTFIVIAQLMNTETVKQNEITHHRNKETITFITHLCRYKNCTTFITEVTGTI